MQTNNTESTFDLSALIAAHPMAPTPSFGSIVDGTVVSITSKGDIWVSFSGKFDGHVGQSELGDEPLNVGDRTQFLVLRGEEVEEGDESGIIELSVRRLQRWKELSKLHQSGSTVSVKVTRVMRSKGKLAGVSVNYHTVRGFIPFPLLGVNQDEVDSLVGSTIEAKIKELSFEERQFVLDRKQVKKDRISALREERLSTLTAGEKISGQVQSIASKRDKTSGKEVAEFGVFVDIGDGVTGLVHRSEIPGLSHQGPIGHVLKVGQPLEVSVLSINDKNGRKELSLGLKSLARSQFLGGLTLHAMVTGKVVRKVAYGLFVNLSASADVDGLLHCSEFGEGGAPVIGSEIEAKIVHLDTNKPAIGLSLRNLS
ncbi:MAG: S1 RNA-binding domain-containing protein [Candidatus Obscuribacterales bacterium]|nr:S1 RNA-binding domain-containing protein [Candidatus Obscuribacterales bacterium]